MFDKFMTTFERSYGTLEEHSRRFEIFVRNLEFHEEEKERHDGLDFGVTQFSDHTDAELRYLIPYQTNVIYKRLPEASSYTQSRPENVDWRMEGKTTPIKDQGTCGSCWAFSTVAAVESTVAIKHGKLFELSPEEILNCELHHSKCQAGYRPFAMEYVRTKGLCNDYKYQNKSVDQNGCFMNCNSTRVFIHGYELLNNEDSIANWIFKNGPLTFSMNITRSLFSYRSGIFNPKPIDCLEKSMGSHAMTIVGYGVSSDSKLYWIIKNSWGLRWGEKGYMRLARGVNSCGMANYAIAPIVK